MCEQSPALRSVEQREALGFQSHLEERVAFRFLALHAEKRHAMEQVRAVEAIEKVAELLEAGFGLDLYHDRDVDVCLGRAPVGRHLQIFKPAELREVGQPFEVKSLCVESIGLLPGLGQIGRQTARLPVLEKLL